MADPRKRVVPEHVRRMLEAMRNQGGPAPGEAAEGGPGPAAAAALPAAAAAPPAPPPPGVIVTEEAAPPDREAAIREQAATLHRQAIADIQAGQMAAARDHLEESLALERGIAVPADMAATLTMLGQVLFSQDDRERGLALARESLGIFQRLDAAETAQ